MGFDYKERLAQHESQQGTVLIRPAPAPAPPLQCSHFQHRLQGSAPRATHCPLLGHMAF